MERYSGTATAIQRNCDFIRQHKPDFIGDPGGDHIYKMNYDDLITFHQEKRADVTIATLTIHAGRSLALWHLGDRQGLPRHRF